MSVPIIHTVGERRSACCVWVVGSVCTSDFVLTLSLFRNSTFENDTGLSSCFLCSRRKRKRHSLTVFGGVRPNRVGAAFCESRRR